MTSPQEDSQCSTHSLSFYILSWNYPTDPIVQLSKINRLGVLGLGASSLLNLAHISFSRLNAHSISFLPSVVKGGSKLFCKNFRGATLLSLGRPPLSFACLEFPLLLNNGGLDFLRGLFHIIPEGQCGRVQTLAPNAVHPERTCLALLSHRRFSHVSPLAASHWEMISSCEFYLRKSRRKLDVNYTKICESH